MPVNITEEFVRHLMEQNAALSDQVAELTATVKELNQTIRELKEQARRVERGWFPKNPKRK